MSDWQKGRIETVTPDAISVLFEVPGRPTQRMYVERRLLPPDMRLIEGSPIEWLFEGNRKDFRVPPPVRLSWWQQLRLRWRARRAIRAGRGRMK